MIVERNIEGVVVRFTLRRISNFHAHGRRDALMRAVVPLIIALTRYTLWMPNNGPIRTIEEMLAYWRELCAIAADTLTRDFDFVMTLYFTEDVTPEVVLKLAKLGIKAGVKYYPPHQGATTGSGFGAHLSRMGKTLRAMEETQLPLLGHFESVFDRKGRMLPHAKREGYMVTEHLWRLRDKYPNLRHCVEHASTKEAVAYVRADTSGRTVMTATPQHSLFTEHDFEEETLGTSLKCMPIVKTPEDRAAILGFITTGDFRAIAGDDTAPHPSKTKHTSFDNAANGCWLPHALGLYAMAFEQAGALDERFEKFMSLNGPAWWGLPPPADNDTITVRRALPGEGVPEPVRVPELNDVVEPLGWKPDKQYEVEYVVETA